MHDTLKASARLSFLFWKTPTTPACFHSSKQLLASASDCFGFALCYSELNIRVKSLKLLSMIKLVSFEEGQIGNFLML
jgi:hypothetical protein